MREHRRQVGNNDEYYVIMPTHYARFSHAYIDALAQTAGRTEATRFYLNRTGRVEEARWHLLEREKKTEKSLKKTE